MYIQIVACCPLSRKIRARTLVFHKTLCMQSVRESTHRKKQILSEILANERNRFCPSITRKKQR